MGGSGAGAGSIDSTDGAVSLTTGVDSYRQAGDGWTECLVDSMPSAQFEHTVLVTDVGVEILTVDSSGRSPAGTLADLEAEATPA